MKTRIAIFLLAAVIFVFGPVAAALTGEAEATPTKPCSISTATGSAPCPPPIVSTNGDQIGGGANSEPINMGDLPRTGPDYTYEAPTYFDEPEAPEAPAEPETDE
ncbi:hypothetical protein SEA_ENNEA_83 [Gordonia phage Ennea]|nr:hypothetical protein SEA_ENNEA_83 [Gordonia phage Ennea]